jgi:hypothetical protein
MTVCRVFGLALVALGIGAGTIIGTPRPHQIPRAGEYFVLTGDFHVHAAVGDGAVAPWELPIEAKRRGLDVIVVTNHNQRVAANLAAARSTPRGGGDPSDPIVIVGQEITTPSFHMVAAGIRETIDWRLSASDAIRAIHAQGGVAIAAHPTPESWRGDPEALALLDGAEVAHPLAVGWAVGRRELMDFYKNAAATNPSLAPIGSSDFHYGDSLGICRTFLFVREISQEGVLEAVRAGRTVAHDRDGIVLGEPSLVANVEGLIASNPPPTQADWASKIVAWVTLFGVAVLLLWR